MKSPTVDCLQDQFTAAATTAAAAATDQTQSHARLHFRL